MIKRGLIATVLLAMPAFTAAAQEKEDVVTLTQVLSLEQGG
jgi:hypothetical protein